jgi:hypothetical protein
MWNSYAIGEIVLKAPSDWKADEIDGMVEMVPIGGEGALHISFLTRSRDSKPDLDEARLLVHSFAMKTNLSNAGAIGVIAEQSVVNAFGEFRAEEESDEIPACWVVSAIIWNDLALQVSFCADQLDRDMLRTIKQVIGSIERRGQ